MLHLETFVGYRAALLIAYCNRVCFINTENNFCFVLFSHKIKLCEDWMISHNSRTGGLGFDILIDT